MVKLKYWHFSRYEDGYHAHGVVSGHPRLEDGVLATTSTIESIKLDSENNRLIMITYSQNEYELLFADVQLMCFEETSDILQEFNIPALDRDKCENLLKQAEKEFLDKVDSILGKNELYLQLSGVFAQRAFFRNNDGKLHEIRTTPHTGMQNDSILITDWEKGEVDFRYWTRFMAIRPYHWSDGLETIKVENIGTTDISFLCDSKIICKAEEITTIKYQQFHREGLFSPDVVNGKCAFGGDYNE